METDAQRILKGVNAKDFKSWETLYAHFYAALCAYAASLTGEPDQAHDIVQDSMIGIWRSGRQFDTFRELTLYLYKSVYNNALSHIRSQNTHNRILRSLPADDNARRDEEYAFAVREELIRQLYVYIDNLPEERRKIVILTLQGASGPEIAEKLGITINTVKTQKKRIFKYLREKIIDPETLAFLPIIHLLFNDLI